MLRDRQQGIQDSPVDQQTRRINPAITAIVSIVFMPYFYPFGHVRAIIVNARRNEVKLHRF